MKSQNCGIVVDKHSSHLKQVRANQAARISRSRTNQTLYRCSSNRSTLFIVKQHKSFLFKKKANNFFPFALRLSGLWRESQLKELLVSSAKIAEFVGGSDCPLFSTQPPIKRMLLKQKPKTKKHVYNPFTNLRYLAAQLHQC